MIKNLAKWLFAALIVASLAAVPARAQSSAVGSLVASSTACATDNSCTVLSLDGGNTSTVTVQLTGTFSATVQFEATVGPTWVALAGVPIGSGALVTSATGTGAWTFSAAGLVAARVRVSTYGSGSVGVNMQSSRGIAGAASQGAASGSCSTSNALTKFTASTTLGCSNETDNGTTLATTLNFSLPASAYANWGATLGTGGYGLRDNSGTIQFKNSAGAWNNIPTATSTGTLANATYFTGFESDGSTSVNLIGVNASNVVEINAAGTVTGVKLNGNLTFGTSPIVNSTTSRIEQVGASQAGVWSPSGLGVGTQGASSSTNVLDVRLDQHNNTFATVINTDTTTSDYNTQAGFDVQVGGNNVGALKSTAKNLAGLSGPSLFLTTIGNYPIAFGVNSSAVPALVLDTTSQLQGVVGSASVPTYSFIGQTGYGAYYASSTYSIATNGTQAVRWDSSQNQTNAGTITVPGGTSPLMVSSSAWTTGAGASAGTLTNAPSVGNPTKWIPINDNGTTRYIPAW